MNVTVKRSIEWRWRWRGGAVSYRASINKTALLSPSNNIIFGLCILTHFFNLNYCFEITTTSYLLWIIGNFLTIIWVELESQSTHSTDFGLPFSILFFRMYGTYIMKTFKSPLLCFNKLCIQLISR